MESQGLLTLHERDNVAIALRPLKKGENLQPGLCLCSDIPQGHKLSLRGIEKGEAILRYGVCLGYAKERIDGGSWVHEQLIRLPEPPSLDQLKPGDGPAPWPPPPPLDTFWGYRNPEGGYAGTRNLLAIHTTVQCVTGVLNVAVERIRRELLPKYPNVDDVVPINHAYGCGVAIDAKEAAIPIRLLRNMIRQPNFGGEVMVLALGCEKLTVEKLLEPQDRRPQNLLVLQELPGFAAMLDAILAMAEDKLRRLNLRKREELPLSALMVGLQCGGSDGLSGITANPAAGYASDLLVGAGATVLFSEVTEVRDAAQHLARRCVEPGVCQRLGQELAWYDAYLAQGQVDRSANPTPGNKAGGLSNVVEKAMGSIAKSGTAPIVEVLAPGERPTRQGLIFAATPASDFVCGTCQLASGIGLQVFMTGRGTPYGLAAAPVIKVSTSRELKALWPDLIDVDAGAIAQGQATVAEMGTVLFHEILDVASGRKKPFAEQYRLHNDLCLFNPAPVT